MRYLIAFCLALVLTTPVLASKAPKPTPYIMLHTTLPDGARFIVRNPTGKRSEFRFECKDAFSEQWIDLPAHSTRTAIITAMQPIEGPCTLVWRVK